MKAGKIVEEFLSAIENNDFSRAMHMLSPNFKVTGVTQEPIGAKEFLELHRSLNQGCPDFRFNQKIISESNDSVDLRVRLTGTQTKTMPSPIPGIKEIKPTNRKINMPEEPVEVKVHNNLIDELILTPVEGGGITGVLRQLGVEIPAEMRHTNRVNE